MSELPDVLELHNGPWRWPAGKTTISYSFLAAGELPSYYVTAFGTPAQGDKYYNVTPFSGAQEAIVESQFRYIESIIPIRFEEAQAGTLGDMTFGFADPGTGNSRTGEGYLAGGGGGDLQGDVWIFHGHGMEGASGTLFAWLTLHEITHTLGLEHPMDDGDGNGNPQQGYFFTDFQDSTQFSILSYKGHPNNWNNNPSSLALYDIAELQLIYGRNTNADPLLGPVGAGVGKDDLYGKGGTIDWGNDDIPFACIYDGGINDFDTLSAAGMSAPAIIDLREGRFSSITNKAQDFSWEDGKSADNVSIAFLTEIEGAVGS